MAVGPVSGHPSSSSGEGGTSAGRGSSGAHADEAQLVRRVKRGDPDALDALMDAYWDPLVAYAYRILGDEQTAEDVTQETFLAIWERRAGLRPGSLSPYLFRTARNRALDEVRSREAREARERNQAKLMQAGLKTPADELEEERIGSMVDQAIHALPPRRREAFTLAYLRDLSYHEIAEIMGISPKTVGHHVSAALAELRERLRPLLREVFPPDRPSG